MLSVMHVCIGCKHKKTKQFTKILYAERSVSLANDVTPTPNNTASPASVRRLHAMRRRNDHTASYTRQRDFSEMFASALLAERTSS